MTNDRFFGWGSSDCNPNSYNGAINLLSQKSRTQLTLVYFVCFVCFVVPREVVSGAVVRQAPVRQIAGPRLAASARR